MRLFSERRIARMERAATTGRVIPYLAVFTVLVTLGAAVFVEVFSPRSFDSFGDALWWAAQTVTTVGYGDEVPQTDGGRLAAVFVMVFGVALISLVTAIVTSGFVARAQRVQQQGELAEHPPVHESLARIEDRLERIEQRLRG
ncbi:MAG: potassium channel family protein [Thermoleophilia bacterium]|nr:potassium channel family protein [Thermoleophilia bacterium]